MLFLLSIWFLVIIAKAWIESKKNFTNHIPGTIGMVIIGMVLSIINQEAFDADYIGTFKFLFLEFSAYWLLFDFAYNSFRGNPLTYIGSTAETDKTFRMLPGVYRGEIWLASKLLLWSISLWIV